MMKVILLLLFSIQLWANSPSDNMYQASSELPSEFRFLIQSIEMTPMNLKERQTYLDNIAHFDYIFSNLKKEAIFFTIKSEIYKSLIKKGISIASNGNWYPPQILSNFQKRSQQFEQKGLVFESWINLAIESDLRNLYKDPLTPALLLALKSDTTPTDASLIKLNKRFRLLWNWHEYFESKSLDEISLDLMPLKFSLLKNLKDDLLLYLQKSTHNLPAISPKNEYRFFKLVKKEISRGLPKDSILDQITSDIIPEKEDQKIDTWKPVELESSKSITPNNKRYSPPKELPRPVNDWRRELLDELVTPYPTPAPSYSPPRELPAPSNDWIDYQLAQ